MNMTVKKLVVVIKGMDNNEVLERWQFDVECDKTVLGERLVILVTVLRLSKYWNRSAFQT